MAKEFPSMGRDRFSPSLDKTPADSNVKSASEQRNDDNNVSPARSDQNDSYHRGGDDDNGTSYYGESLQETTNRPRVEPVEPVSTPPASPNLKTPTR